MDNPTKSAREGVGALTDLIKAVGDSPTGREATTNLGHAAVTLTKTINNALLPLAAINFAIDRARQYFSERFQAELLTQASSIPAQDVVEPKASIAGPVLHALAFSHEEPDLKNLYLRLLTSAMDRRVSDDVHPAFVDVIRQMTAHEALLLNKFLLKASYPIAEIRGSSQVEDAIYVLQRNVLDVGSLSGGAFTDVRRARVYVDNWIRLGLVRVEFGGDPNPFDYQWIFKAPELGLVDSKVDGTVHVVGGRLIRTDFGFAFARAVGLSPGASGGGVLSP